MEIAESDGSGFALSISYSDPDENRATADTVVVTSTGSSKVAVNGAHKRVVSTTITVPPDVSGPLFSDDFDQLNVLSFDERYQIGAPANASGFMTPFTTVADAVSGDINNVFTHSSEPGGTASVLKIGGDSEARLILSAGSCLAWSVSSDSTVCDYTACSTMPGCEKRKGVDVAPDPDGYQNYFIKLRARLVAGSGFGVYFRSSYSNEDDPYLIDFGSLTGYTWQYDSGMGYLLPCDFFTMIPGSDGSGMLLTRRVENGSELCGAECGLFTAQASPDTYPFFCPENKANDTLIPGWQWSNADWPGEWRTVYVYVYRDTVKIYLDREEISGGAPALIGVVALDSIASLLPTGGIGLRTWNGSVVEVDYIEIYGNDDNNDASTYLGE